MPVGVKKARTAAANPGVAPAPPPLAQAPGGIMHAPARGALESYRPGTLAQAPGGIQHAPGFSAKTLASAYAFEAASPPLLDLTGGYYTGIGQDDPLPGGVRTFYGLAETPIQIGPVDTGTNAPPLSAFNAEGQSILNQAMDRARAGKAGSDFPMLNQIDDNLRYWLGTGAITPQDAVDFTGKASYYGWEVGPYTDPTSPTPTPPATPTPTPTPTATAPASASASASASPAPAPPAPAPAGPPPGSSPGANYGYGYPAGTATPAATLAGMPATAPAGNYGYGPPTPQQAAGMDVSAPGQGPYTGTFTDALSGDLTDPTWAAAYRQTDAFRSTPRAPILGAPGMAGRPVGVGG